MSTEITINQSTIDINVTEQVITIEAPSGAYPLPSTVSSVFGRTGNIIALNGDYNTSLVTENTNLYFTNTRARNAISLTTTGTSGAATYNSTTGVLNVPEYQGGVTSFNTRTGAISLLSADVTGALGFTPYNATNPAGYISGITSGMVTTALGYTPVTNARTLTINGTSYDLSADRSWTISAGVSSVGLSAPTGFSVTNSPITTSGTLALGFSAGYSLPTDASQATWNTAYNRSLLSAAVTGTTTKTLTLNQQDGGTITASWTDINTDAVTSVFGRTGAVVATEGDYTLTQLGDVTITTPANGQVLKYNGTSWVNGTDTDTGLTSVGLSMPSAFTVTNSPLTANGTLSVTGAGTTAQYVRGDGTLATFPSVAQEAQRLITEVYNNSGATLTKGTVVYINGGQGNLPTVTKALATGDATSAQTYGIVQADITNMNNGFVVVIGSLSDLDTQAYAVGTQLYLSSTVAGAWTSVKQYAPAHLVYVAIVVRSHPTQGVVEVRIQNGFEMDELHNVAAQSPSNGSILQYVSSTSLWTSVAGTTTNIAEGTNLYYTDARSRAALSFTAGSGAYNSTTGVITIPTNNNQITNGSNFITLASLSAGTGISYNNTTGVIINSAPDQTVSLSNGTGISVSGTYPSFTIASTITQYTDALARASISLTTTGSSGAATYNSTTGVLNIPQYSGGGGGGMAIGGSITSATAGSVLFAGASGVLAQDNANFFWDDTNNRLGIGSTTLGSSLQINGNAAIGFSTSTAAPSNGLRVAGVTLTGTGFGANITSLSAWGTVLPMIEGLNANSIAYYNAANASELYLSTNAYFNGSSWVRSIVNGAAQVVLSGSNQNIIFQNAASGAAGSTISWTNLLYIGSASGVIGIGTSTIGSKLQVNGNAAIGYSASTAAPTNGLAVAGQSTFADNLLISKNGNAATLLTISNTTNGTGAFSAFQLNTNASGSIEYGKYSQTKTGYKNISSGDAYMYNATYGNISIINDFASGNINFAAGASSTAQLTIASTGAITATSTITSTQYRLSALNTAPATSTSTGTLGEIRIDGTAIYVCTATNTWVRALLTTF